MEIAPGINAEEWNNLRLDDDESADWKRAVEILEARINGRFIEPIDQLIAAEESTPPKQRRFGFVVLAVDCLLVETLWAFRQGWTTGEGKAREAFVGFLTTRPKFQKLFNSPDLAERFYKEFRCGILHQGETSSNSRVWSTGELLQCNDDQIIVNRTKFHKRLKEEFQDYSAELQDLSNAPLRKNFRKKMDFISRKHKLPPKSQ
jgi:hypothetical protein